MENSKFRKIQNLKISYVFWELRNRKAKNLKNRKSYNQKGNKLKIHQPHSLTRPVGCLRDSFKYLSAITRQENPQIF